MAITEAYLERCRAVPLSMIFRRHWKHIGYPNRVQLSMAGVEALWIWYEERFAHMETLEIVDWCAPRVNNQVKVFIIHGPFNMETVQTVYRVFIVNY
jgi:hypothetical protein